jgi:Flp pilus assembly protein TadG
MLLHQPPRFGRRLGEAKGQSLIEAAITLPLLLLITFAIIDFGILFWVDLSLESGVSQAARYGVTGAAQAGMSREESIKDALRRVTPSLDIDDADIEISHLASGDWAAGIGGPGSIQRIAVTYQHKVLVLTPFFDDGQIALRAESTMKNEERFE